MTKRKLEDSVAKVGCSETKRRRFVSEEMTSIQSVQDLLHGLRLSIEDIKIEARGRSRIEGVLEDKAIIQSMRDQMGMNFFSLVRENLSTAYLSSEIIENLMEIVFSSLTKHDDSALLLLLDLINMLEGSPLAEEFYTSYYLQLLKEILIFLVNVQPLNLNCVLALNKLLCLVDEHLEPSFVSNYTSQILASLFPSKTTKEVSRFVCQLVTSRVNLNMFKVKLRSFLLHSKEFTLLRS